MEVLTYVSCMDPASAMETPSPKQSDNKVPDSDPIYLRSSWDPILQVPLTYVYPWYLWCSLRIYMGIITLQVIPTLII